MTEENEEMAGQEGEKSDGGWEKNVEDRIAGVLPCHVWEGDLMMGWMIVEMGMVWAWAWA